MVEKRVRGCHKVGGGRHGGKCVASWRGGRDG